MKNKKNIIYKVSNNANDRVYIGASSKHLNSRRSDHLQKANKGLEGKFYEAIRTYGPDVFVWSVIDEASDIDELAQKEKYWIQHYNSVKNGYNSDSGGGFKKSIHQYDLDSRLWIAEYDCLQSEASASNTNRKYISRAALSVNKEYAGYLWSYEKHEELPAAQDKRRRKVVQYDLAGNWLAEFNSVADASRFTGVSKSYIAKVCRYERTVAKGFKWSYNL